MRPPDAGATLSASPNPPQDLSHQGSAHCLRLFQSISGVAGFLRQWGPAPPALARRRSHDPTRGGPASPVGGSDARRRDMRWHRCAGRPPFWHSRGTAALLLLSLVASMSEVIMASAGVGARHVDLIESLQLWNTTYTGLTVIPGPRPIAPAVFLQGDNRDVRLPSRIQKAAETLLSGTKEFTFMATLQQEERNAGTILAFSKGPQRYLELQSSGRKDEIRLHYISNGAVHVEVFPFRLADQKWHKVAVSVSGTQLEVWIDCRRIYRRVVPPPSTNFTKLAIMDPPYDPSEPVLPTTTSIPGYGSQTMSLFLGQRNPGHFLFRGALQDVRVVEGAAGHLLQCPQAEAQCPTCGGFQQLAEQVAMLQDLVAQLTQKVTSTEARLASIEECDCQRSCRVNGTVRQDGASWKIGCEICSCRQGEVTCRPVPCPNPSCKNPVYTEGECCPMCLKQCSLKGVVYDHGETVSPRQCVDCECRDGKMQCRRIDPEAACPELPCPQSEQFSVPGQCCKFCPGIDYCAKEHTCHRNASCINLQTTYTCHCNQGFTGDGENCQDIDECQAIGAHHGHYCQAHTTCINTLGSYECRCQDGFIRHDEFSCLEHDECEAGSHNCHEQAICINTKGSYQCECKEGYQGDGTHCQPICKSSCLNGGVCIKPDVCVCRLGFTGKSCEIDVDECSLELHRCPKNSRCINLPGWYACQCTPGFSSLLSHNSKTRFCKDIDECHLGTHTCHSSAKCVNTEGSFECQCSKNSTNCSLNCVMEGKEHTNGDSWTPKKSVCSQCLCSDGKVTCDQFACDCSSSSQADPACCPQCSAKSLCHHHGRTYASRQKWIHQCQTCECLYGEVDCWPMECPPVSCEHPIRIPGDCCPRCPEDPCIAWPMTNVSSNPEISSPQPCHYLSQSMEWSALIEERQGHECQMPYCSELIDRGGAGNVLRANSLVVFLPMMLSLFYTSLPCWPHPSHIACIVLIFLCNILTSISIRLVRKFFYTIPVMGLLIRRRPVYRSSPEAPLSKGGDLHPRKTCTAPFCHWVSSYYTGTTSTLPRSKIKLKIGSSGRITRWFRSPKAKRSRRKETAIWTKRKKRSRSSLR